MIITRTIFCGCTIRLLDMSYLEVARGYTGTDKKTTKASLRHHVTSAGAWFGHIPAEAVNGCSNHIDTWSTHFQTAEIVNDSNIDNSSQPPPQIHFVHCQLVWPRALTVS